MTLSQALLAVGQAKSLATRRKVLLACGFQPLHLPPFLKAHFSERNPATGLDVVTGLYGDLQGTLDRGVSDATALIVVIEWADLDPRLGLRSSGGWGPKVQAEILDSARSGSARLLAAIVRAAGTAPVIVAGPAAPPIFFGQTSSSQFSAAEAELNVVLASLLSDAARIPNTSVAHPSALDRLVPSADRIDAKMELGAGFPYTIPYASALATQLVALLQPAAPKKGLITDLDDTFWAGLVGEIGPNAVSWNLTEHSQVHGMYQQQLKQLAEMGVLLGIASKNEPAVVDQALARTDLYVKADSFFPVKVSWNAKSQAVADIIRTWNINADAVVFVDDSPMELDEVRTANPGITCLQFEKNQPAKVIALLEQLRDLFGKPVVMQEDALRLASIRASASIQEEAGHSASPEFLRSLQGRVIFDSSKDKTNKRLLELVNKTNQFNLNGRRISEGDWLRLLNDPSAVIVGVSYEDKFGPLGIIGVAIGQHNGNRLTLSSWVLSCRAFSRQIELHALDYFFRTLPIESIALDFEPTERNMPLQDMLSSLGLDVSQPGIVELPRTAFAEKQATLPHQVEDTINQPA